MPHDTDTGRPPPLPPLPAGFIAQHDRIMTGAGRQLDQWIGKFRTRVADNGGAADRAIVEFVAAMAGNLAHGEDEAMLLVLAVAIARLAAS